MAKQLRKIGIHIDDDEPHTAHASNTEHYIDEILLDALNKLAALYQPCPQQEVVEYITSQHLYDLLQELYPSDYTQEEIVQALTGFGYSFFLHPVLGKYYWQVKKIA